MNHCGLIINRSGGGRRRAAEPRGFFRAGRKSRAFPHTEGRSPEEAAEPLELGWTFPEAELFGTLAAVSLM